MNNLFMPELKSGYFADGFLAGTGAVVDK